MMKICSGAPCRKGLAPLPWALAQVGLCGKDSDIILARQMVEKDIGFVGEVTSVDADLIEVSNSNSNQLDLNCALVAHYGFISSLRTADASRAMGAVTCVSGADAGERWVYPCRGICGLQRQGPGAERQRRHSSWRGGFSASQQKYLNSFRCLF